LALEYELIRVDPFENNNGHPELLELNPDGKVPVLKHNDVVMLESLAIIEYLDGVSGKAELVPNAHIDVYHFRKSIHFGLTEIEPYLWLSEQADGPLSNLYHWPKGVYSESLARVKESSATLEKLILEKNPDGSCYLMGAKFSLADIYYYHILTWAKQHGINFGSHTESYLTHLEHRDKFPKEMYWQ